MTYITKPVHLFPALVGGITTTTKIPVAQRSIADAPDDAHITPLELVTFLQQYGLVIVPENRTYTDDDAAAADGLAIGDPYYLSLNNSYNLPAGLLKKRTE